jgi:CheY-like chemotaxis protein
MKAERNTGATVLVVDDDEILRRLICKTLETDGFRVLTAINGADALTACRDAKPPVELLVTDYSMPDMTGLQLARECCSLNPELNVLYVSGSWPGDALRRDLALGRRRFLAKPFLQSELLCNARAVLDMQSEVAPSRKSRISG